MNILIIRMLKCGKPQKGCLFLKIEVFQKLEVVSKMLIKQAKVTNVNYDNLIDIFHNNN